MTEPFTREAIQQMRERAEAGWSVGTPTLLRLIAMAERLLQVEPVVEAAKEVAIRQRDASEPLPWTLELLALQDTCVAAGLISTSAG